MTNDGTPCMYCGSKAVPHYKMSCIENLRTQLAAAERERDELADRLFTVESELNVRTADWNIAVGLLDEARDLAHEQTERAEQAERERGELRQRVQVAEKAARTTIDDCRRQGVSLGRSLANYAYQQERTRAERAEAIAKAAQEYIKESPCDPDITEKQAIAWAKYEAVRTGGPV